MQKRSKSPIFWIQHKRWFGCLKHAFITWYKLISPSVPNVRRLLISGFNLTSVLSNVKYDSNVFSPCNNTGPNKTGDTHDELTRRGCLKVVTIMLWSHILNVGSIPKIDELLLAQTSWCHPIDGYWLALRWIQELLWLLGEMGFQKFVALSTFQLTPRCYQQPSFFYCLLEIS